MDRIITLISRWQAQQHLPGKEWRWPDGRKVSREEYSEIFDQLLDDWLGLDYLKHLGVNGRSDI